VGRRKEIRACWDESIGDIGIRLRPFLLRISAEAGGLCFPDVLPVAAGIEMIQISTLVIDDVLDQSSLRNAAPSIFARYGTAEAISIGIVMASEGFLLVADGLRENRKIRNGLSIMAVLAETHANIYFGQFLDLRFEANTSITEERYLDMIRNTTACFIQAPLVVGAMMWDASAATIELLERAGIALGMAYQIRDDVIDIIGDSECTGKPIAGDIRRSKMRLPVIRALRTLPGKCGNNLKGLLSNRGLPDKAVRESIELINKTDAVDYCISVTKQYCETAQQFIGKLPGNLGVLRNQLNSIAELIASFEG
jgi:geranylgeranyl pyrophosphate synthase